MEVAVSHVRLSDRLTPSPRRRQARSSHSKRVTQSAVMRLCIVLLMATSGCADQNPQDKLGAQSSFGKTAPTPAASPQVAVESSPPKSASAPAVATQSAENPGRQLQTAPAPATRCPVPVDVSFVMDGSSSMIYDVFNARSFVQTLASQLDFEAGAQSSVVRFSNFATTLTANPQLSTSGTAVHNAVNNYFAMGYTNIGSGLQMAMDIWSRAEAGDTSAGIITGNPKVIVLLSDGENTAQYGGQAGALRVADQVKASGVTIFAVGFSSVSQETLRLLASTPCAHAPFC